jgi:hypothetical protein
MAVTMGMAFYFIPLVLLSGTIAFALRWRVRAREDKDPEPFPKEAVKDPLIVSAVLIGSGMGTIAFLTGGLGAEDYFSIPVDALVVLREAATDWTEPFAAESIALKGGVFIGLACTVVVVFSVLSHFRRRLDDGESKPLIEPGRR